MGKIYNKAIRKLDNRVSAWRKFMDMKGTEMQVEIRRKSGGYRKPGSMNAKKS